MYSINMTWKDAALLHGDMSNSSNGYTAGMHHYTKYEQTPVHPLDCARFPIIDIVELKRRNLIVLGYSGRMMKFRVGILQSNSNLDL